MRFRCFGVPGLELVFGENCRELEYSVNEMRVNGFVRFTHC